MKSEEIPQARLLRQRIAGEGLDSPADAVRWMGAVQAQDYAAAKWAVALRTTSCSDAELEAAFSRGEILRTHVMRPTWHFLVPEDARWMQALTASRVEAALAYQYRRLELDPQLLQRSQAAMEKALLGGKQLTRAELGAALARRGIYVEGPSLAHVILHAELEALLCSGGRRGKQFTYALLDERAPRPRRLERDEALATLTERYFTSHGPATTRDFAWWSGLPATDITAGLEMVKSRLVREEAGGRIYWMSPTAPAKRYTAGTAYLLGNYDEYIVGYTERDAIFDQIHAKNLDERRNPLFNHTIVAGGRIAGTWTRSPERSTVRIELKPFAEPGKAQRRAMTQSVKRYRAYLGEK